MSAANVKFYTLAHEPTTVDKAERFGFTCPKGRGTCSGLLIAGRTTIKRDGQNANGGRAQWDLRNAAPGQETFSPSVNCKGCWHGYVENGRCVDTQHVDEPEPPVKGQ